LRLDPWIAIPALLLFVAMSWLWFKAISRLKPGSTSDKINTTVFNVVMVVPMLFGIVVAKIGFFAIYPFWNFQTMWRDSPAVAIFVLVASFPAYALLAVVVATLFGYIPLY
jgi:hypothetical protein